MPRDPEHRRILRALWEDVAAEEGQSVLGWREVPCDNSCLSRPVTDTEPVHEQIFIARGPDTPDEEAFERKLFVIRKVVSNRQRALRTARLEGYYPVSLSARTVVYKGMFLAYQLGRVLSRSARRAVQVGAGSSISASRPTPSPPGRWPTPTGWWPITARSTR
jgi:glutamate synthase (NADPH) large chain